MKASPLVVATALLKCPEARAAFKRIGDGEADAVHLSATVRLMTTRIREIFNEAPTCADLGAVLLQVTDLLYPPRPPCR